jgi:4-hydroxybenzoate polyprenyltransferase
MDRILLYATCLRPNQWTKNLVLLAALIFSKSFFVGHLAARSLAGLGVFCLLSGAIYCFNDLMDYEQDRQHPSKRSRPVASGRVSRGGALVLGLVAVSAGLISAWFLGRSFLLVAAIYVAVTVLYSFGLKHIVVPDVMLISIGFVLRAIAGVEVLQAVEPSIVLSPWLLVCTLFLALFLGFNKRRHELHLLAENAGLHRKSLDEYSTAFLDAMISVVTAATVIAYAIYTIWPATVDKFSTQNLIYTVPFVVFGLFRYMYLVLVKKRGGSPSEVLVGDLPLVIDIILWLLVAGAVLYLA